VLENDAVHGPQAQATLAGLHAETWEKYRHQKHDLFISKNDTRDYFLTDVATSQPAFMLKNAAEWGAEGGGSGAPPASRFGEAAPDAPFGAAPTSPTAAWTGAGPPPAPEAIAPKAFSLPGFQAPVDPFAPSAGAGGGNPFAAPAPAPAPASADPFADML
jgi:hypothetical protein